MVCLLLGVPGLRPKIGLVLLCCLQSSLLALFQVRCATAATLTGSYAEVPAGSTVDLSALGAIDWVHWGFLTANTITRKASVPPEIGPLTALGAQVNVFRYADNFNGYHWVDGWPSPVATNTTTGIWAYGNRQIGSGFELRLPADETPRVAKVYVGVFAGVGEFHATLNDATVADYSDATLTNLANGPGRVYTIEYTGTNGPLIIRWTLVAAHAADGNVTFQAAALTSATANNPPVVSLTSPATNAAVAAGSMVTLAADAFDLDGQVEKVEFWDNGTKLGEVFDAPYDWLLQGVALGPHQLTAKAIDAVGAQRTSAPVEIFAHSNGGLLRGSRTTPPRAVDLTGEGTLDWAHWGYPSAGIFNHKAGVQSEISDVVTSRPFEQYSNNYAGFSWTNGTPIASAQNTTSGIFVTGVTNGFELTVGTATILRRLKVYAGLYGAQGNFQAFLSDFSAPVYADTTAMNISGDRWDVYTLDFAAASPGQMLTVRYRSAFAFDREFGNVTLQAATLQSVGPVFSNPVWQPDGFSFSFGTEPGKTYAVEFAETPDATVWSLVTNVVGSGEIIPVMDTLRAAQGFYRVTIQVGQ